MAAQKVAVHVAACAVAGAPQKPLGLEDSLVEVAAHCVRSHCVSSTDGTPALVDGRHSRCTPRGR